MGSIDDLAAACGVARRTLEKHFRRFVGRSPSQVRRELVLERVRRELLRAQAEVCISKLPCAAASYSCCSSAASAPR
jgi:transcriptional regulator GlxA family with amidase domain